ncbi:MAG TPA: hypothetical protein VLF69_01985 [Candidatus Saccharimonadales bacterium]|nr:hypothetical protein [Candidatus Saccharimonadales bacterium]
MKTTRLQLAVLVMLLGCTGLALWQRQAIIDWLLLRNYTPPVAVVQLAGDDTMTAKARHLFYVNHPQISNGKLFSSHCPAGSEKTVVLGCYLGNDHGIYLYQITNDPRLNGVEQVTAAHEMLHAAYRRLSSGERTKVDAMLMSYYQHGLTDQRIKDTIDAYKQSEPHDVVNEMHSIFGTEVADLPATLEAYYQQYFTDRSKVAAYTASYQGEFTSRKAQVAQYDAQLQDLGQQIDANNKLLDVQKKNLNTQSQQLQAERGNVGTYNRDVVTYNQLVDRYNELVAQTKRLISQYNTIVDERNSIALEEQQLTQELSASSLPSK